MGWGFGKFGCDDHCATNYTYNKSHRGTKKFSVFPYIMSALFILTFYFAYIIALSYHCAYPFQYFIFQKDLMSKNTGREYKGKEDDPVARMDSLLRRGTPPELSSRHGNIDHFFSLSLFLIPSFLPFILPSSLPPFRLSVFLSFFLLLLGHICGICKPQARG